MTVRNGNFQQLFYFFYPIEEGAPVNMKKFRSFCGIPVMIQIRPQRLYKIRMICFVIILQLKNMIVDPHFQFLIITFGKEIFRQGIGAVKQRLIRCLQIGQFQGVQRLIVEDPDLQDIRKRLKLTFR